MTKIVPLDVEGLKVYKSQNPAKFFSKFGDLDLDNLPENFNIEVHKKMVLQGLPKTPLMPELEKTVVVEIKKEDRLQDNEPK